MSSVTEQTETLFYDGYCALCHSAVKFVLKHDRGGTAFRFAPLQGKAFTARVSPDQRAAVRESVVVQTRDGSLLVSSSAWVHILRQLGGGWKIAASLLGAIPRPLRDRLYDFVARIRYRVFGRRESLCPMVAPDLLPRFDE
jgi:predicted DCC family thiol-disulfide oxidoreductase YuxK